MAQFNNTTTKDGLIQKCEFWTRHEDAGISGNATLLLQFTDRINTAFERITPLLLSYADYIRWDDNNHTDRPVGTINLVSGQEDYKITEDANSLDILNINAIRIIPSATGTDYSQTLERITLDDDRALEAMSPDSATTGIPSGFVENGNKIYLYPTPDYSINNGIKIYFAREHSRFVSTDTTKEPGIPKPFHELLALYASLDWNMVNRTDDGNLISMIKQEIDRQEKDLRNVIAMRNPTKLIMTTKGIKFR